MQWSYQEQGEQQVDDEERKEAPEEDGLFGTEAADKGDKMGAVKPYIGQLKASIPSWFKPNPARDNTLPSGDLKLMW